MKLRPAEEIIKENFKFFHTLASSDKRAFIDCVNAGRREVIKQCANAASNYIISPIGTASHIEEEILSLINELK